MQQNVHFAKGTFLLVAFIPLGHAVITDVITTHPANAEKSEGVEGTGLDYPSKTLPKRFDTFSFCIS